MTGLDTYVDTKGNVLETYHEKHPVFTSMGSNSSNMEEDDGFIYSECLFRFVKPMDCSDNKYKTDVFECPVDANGNKGTILKILFLEKRRGGKEAF